MNDGMSDPSRPLPDQYAEVLEQAYGEYVAHEVACTDPAQALTFLAGLSFISGEGDLAELKAPDHTKILVVIVFKQSGSFSSILFNTIVYSLLGWLVVATVSFLVRPATTAIDALNGFIGIGWICGLFCGLFWGMWGRKRTLSSDIKPFRMRCCPSRSRCRLAGSKRWIASHRRCPAALFCRSGR